MFSAVVLLAALYIHATDAAACSVGWDPFGGKCYLVVHGRTPFSHATYMCAKLGATLVQLTSQAEANAANVFATLHNIPRYWVGVQGAGNTWRFRDGTVAPFTNFRHTQPDGCCGPLVNCAMANLHGTWGQWDDISCADQTHTDGYICQK